MPSANISNLGFTAQFAPQIKRATATLSDGSAVMIVPDANLAAITGADDVTGVAKIRIYKSDTTRTTWTLNATITPATVFCSSTIAAVMSMVLDSADNMHIVYRGTDNSLRYLYSAYSAGSYTAAATTQTVIAANAVTTRFRAVDLDVVGTGTTANVAVIVYETTLSSGAGYTLNVWVRLNNGTSWINAWTNPIWNTTLFSYIGSEDVSISWDTSGIVSNIGRFLIFYTRTATNADFGDLTVEISFNVSTGTTASATMLGVWPIFNQNVASGYRRGWVFKTTNNIWQVAMLVGSSSPTFQVMRLTHGAYGAPSIDKTVTFPGGVRRVIGANSVVNVTTPLAPQVYIGINPENAIGCTYADNRVMFGFITRNVFTAMSSTLGATAACVIFRYNDAATYNVSYIDNQMRPLDNYTSYGDTPIGVYGSGNNRNQAGDLKFNFLVLYGYAGNTTLNFNKARAVVDTFYDPPIQIGPTLTQSIDTPLLQVRVQNSALYPNVKGKIEWNLARDAAFTVDSRTIAEPDSAYANFGSTNASIPPPISRSLKLSGIGIQKLYSGVWYMRSRVVSDLGTNSVYSLTSSFTVAHVPSANPASPTPGQLVLFGQAGAITFAWKYSDTEPTDAQTAYRLIIMRQDTGSTVLDTGKTASSQNSTTQTISSSLKDIPLQWSVSLWDTDDVQGPFSNPILFTISDAPTVAVTSPTNGATVTTALPTVTWTPTFAGARTQRSFRVTAFKVDNLDSFVRGAVASGWGTSDSGGVWTSDLGSASDYSTNGSVGLQSHGATSTRNRNIIGTAIADSDQSVTVTVPVVTTGANFIEASLIARRIDVNNYYFAGVRFGLAGALTAFIGKKVGGGNSDIATFAMTQTYTATSTWNIRFKVSGTTQYIKIWSTSASEPQAWTIVTFDSTNVLRSSGTLGVDSNVSSGVTNGLPIVFSFDNYYEFDPNLAVNTGDSGWVMSSAGAYTFPSNVLANNLFYAIQVTLQDSAGLMTTGMVSFQTNWVHPLLGNMSIVTDAYGATISWTNANTDVSFVAYRVYRRYRVTALDDTDDGNTRNLWFLAYESRDSLASYSFKDYLIPCNKPTDYVVVQLADRFGSMIESNITAFTTVTLTSDRYYFIPAVAIGTIASYEAGNVIDDSYQDEVESATLHVLNRGRQVQVGDDLGVTGTLQIQLRNPNGSRADREFIQYLASSKTLNLWMKNPFGDVRYVKFLSVSVKILAGTGLTEMADLSVPYVEVFGDPPVTRL